MGSEDHHFSWPVSARPIMLTMMTSLSLLSLTMPVSYVAAVGYTHVLDLIGLENACGSLVALRSINIVFGKINDYSSFHSYESY